MPALRGTRIAASHVSCQRKPPSAVSSQRSRSEVRNTTIFAISSGCPKRPSGVCVTICFSKSLPVMRYVCRPRRYLSRHRDWAFLHAWDVTRTSVGKTGGSGDQGHTMQALIPALESGSGKVVEAQARRPAVAGDCKFTLIVEIISRPDPRVAR